MTPILDGPISNHHPDWLYYPDDTIDTIAIPLIDDDPALTHANYKHKRQTQPADLEVPRCMTRCMGAANTGHCASNADFLCLCSNRDYQTGVTQCWAAACNATAYDLALSYVASACTALGAKIAHPDNPASTNITMMPIVYSRASYHIQMIVRFPASPRPCVN
ncbi:hypothetical protein CcaverHIS002_0407660 [Cutaneotrichosporon cavernicola]|nr:hypothetical protein CcaverHIS002_0407660 [Cutaneotrichosporon cavernicola]BEJ07491.1 hypothetical protein CcaverHIS641_0407600 [Cutaneotrichosporon cavernicola]